MRMFGWSCNVFLSGQTILTDYRNRALRRGGADFAGGVRGCLVQCRGDWEFFCNLFRFTRWDSADMMCPFCKASATDRARSWTNFGIDAAWLNTRWTHEAYIDWLRAAGVAIPVLFAVVLGCSPLRRPRHCVARCGERHLARCRSSEMLRWIVLRTTNNELRW